MDPSDSSLLCAVHVPLCACTLLATDVCTVDVFFSNADKKNHELFHIVEVKVFCMCNSFVTRNEGTNNQEPTKKCMILFWPGSILTRQVSVMNEHKDSLKDFFSSLGADWSVLLNVHNTMALSQDIKQGITECLENMSCLLHEQENGLTCHRSLQKGKWQ